MFENFFNLFKLEFNILGEFKIINIFFEGFKFFLFCSFDMLFRNYVDCDVLEDLFCLFLYLDINISISFGGKCSIYVVLRLFKCL